MSVELLANIPQELRAPALWLQYYETRDPKKPDKKPGKHPCVKYSTPEFRKANLRSLDDLLKRRPQAGFQRYVDKAEGLVFVDLDKVRDPVRCEVEPWASALIDELDSYTEISASGKGFHIVCRGRLPEDFHLDPNQVEIYSGNIPNKLMAMTGNVLDPFHSVIEDRQEKVAQLLKRMKGTTAIVEVTEPQEPQEEQHLDLPDEALDGWLGKVCRERMDEFPVAAAWIALVTAASVHVPSENRCNLNGILVGRMGDGKTEISKRGMWLMSADAPPQRETITPGSGEGLIRLFENTGGGRRLLYQDEVADMMGKARIESSSLGQKLNELWGADAIGTVVKKDTMKAEVRLSILGNLVNDRFDEAFHAGTVLGFYRRVLFGEYPLWFPPYLYRPITGERAFVPFNEDEPQDAFANTLDCPQPKPVRILDSVYDERDRWIKQEGIEPYLAEPVLRVAVVCASFDGRTELHPDDLGPTFALLKYQAAARQWLKPNLGENLEAILHNRLMDYLRRFAPNGTAMKRRDLLTRTHAYERFGGPMVERVLMSLVRQQLVVLDSRISSGPRGKTETIALSEEERNPGQLPPAPLRGGTA